MVMERVAVDWNSAKSENDYRRDLRAMLEAKLAGEEIRRPEPVAETPVVDLMEALRRSVADAQERKQAKPAKPKAGSTGNGSRRKAPARKSASARTPPFR